VLTLWRARLRGSGRPERIFEAVRAVVAQTGVLRGRQRRALDSTLLDDAVATQDTVTQLVAAIRRVRQLIPAAATLTLAAHDYDLSINRHKEVTYEAVEHDAPVCGLKGIGIQSCHRSLHGDTTKGSAVADVVAGPPDAFLRRIHIAHTFSSSP